MLRGRCFPIITCGYNARSLLPSCCQICGCQDIIIIFVPLFFMWRCKTSACGGAFISSVLLSHVVDICFHLWCFQVPCDGQAPLDVECAVEDSAVCAANGCDLHQNAICTLNGLRCVHMDQPIIDGNQCRCCDYKVRFLCPGNGFLLYVWSYSLTLL